MSLVTDRVWRPFVDEPLFVPELALGTSELDPNTYAAIEHYLEAVLRRRQAPLHIAVAWNALHFGFDVDFGGYVGGLVDPDAFDEVSLGARLPALPVGAMVRVRSGQTPVWAEVTYKEGTHPEIDADGFVPPQLSGAPTQPINDGQEALTAGAGEDAALLRERLALDFSAFGPLDERSRITLRRLRQRGYLDQLAHVVTNAVYTPAADAELDDLSFYARYLFARRRGLVTTGPLGLALEHPTEEQLLQALLTSLRTTRDVLSGLPGVLMWRDYAIRQDDLEARLGDRDRLLGGGDLDDFVHRLGVAHPGEVRHTAIGPALLALTSTAGSGDVFDALGETRYASAVCHANLALARMIERSGGSGQLPSGVHLRLDDGWQGGGIWRAEGPGTAADAHQGVGPFVPLGLGHAASAPPTPPADAATSGGQLEPSTEHTAEVAEESPGEETLGIGVIESIDDVELTASHATFRVVLRTLYLETETLPIPAEVEADLQAAVAEHGQPGVRLVHDGEELQPGEDFHRPLDLQDGPTRLAGIAWPLDFHPGLVLACGLSRGGVIVDARTRRLTEPAYVGGVEVSHETNFEILRAALGLTEPTGHGGAGEPIAIRGPWALGALLVRALRRHGHPGPSASRRATAYELVATIYGGLPRPDDALQRARDALGMLVARSKLEQVPGERRKDHTGLRITQDADSYVWWPSTADRSTALPGVQTTFTSGLERVTRRHQVQIFLRKLPPGYQASPEKDATYQSMRAELGPHCLLPKTLPTGCTWVEAHERGEVIPLERIAVRVR